MKTRDSAVARRSAGFALGNVDRGKLRAVHTREVDEVAVGIDNGNVQLPAMLGGLGLNRGDQLLRSLQTDRSAVWNIERRAIRRTAGGRRRCWCGWRYGVCAWRGALITAEPQAVNDVNTSVRIRILLKCRCAVSGSARSKHYGTRKHGPGSRKSRKL